jgi:hypothetical protein
VPESVQDIARQAVGQLGLDRGYALGTQFASEAYQEVCARAKFRHLRKIGQIYLPAPFQAGSITLTLDSPVVTLNAVALAAAQANQFYKWPEGFSGLWFRPQIGITWYRIAEAYVANGIGTLILETPFAYDNSYLVGTSQLTQSNVTYFIIPRYQQLDPTARQLGVFMVDYVFRPLRVVSEDQLNRMVPGRFLISSYPEYVAELNSNLNLTGMPKQIEVYPYPSNSVTLHYTFWQTPPVLGFGDYLPPTIDTDIIRTGTKMFLAGSESGKAVRAGNMEAAAYWRNVANQEETKYEGKINRAIRNDRGPEDLKMTIRRMGWQGPIDYDAITTAFENFLAVGY